MRYLWFIFAYLAVVVIYGLYITKKKVKESKDFANAGKSLPLVIVLGTLIATWFGGGSITGCANIVYSRGIIPGLIYQYATPIGLIVVFFLAGRIRATEETSVAGLFTKRYNKVAGILAAVFIVLSYIGTASYQFKGAGYILNITTGIPVPVGTAIAAVVIVILCVSGGLTSVAYTDSISAFFIFLSFMLAIPCLLMKSGGFAGLTAQIPDSYFTLAGAQNNAASSWGVLIATSVLAMGDQNLFIRFAASKDRKTAKKSAGLMIIGCLILGTCVVLIESYAIPYLKDIKPDTALMMVAMNLLPFGVGGLLLSACVAFLMTTGDSYLLSSATTLDADVLVPYFIKKPKTDRQNMIRLRLVVVLIGLVAYLLIAKFTDILSIIMYAYTVYAAAISPSLVAALLWKRATPAGAVTSIALGGTCALVWELFLKNTIGNGLDSSLIAIPVSVAALIVVSLLTKPKQEAVLETN
ncbi:MULTISPECIES: sodium:solute symporter family protein [Acutalibacteraceae]|uniref:sodium:solute symporter family protein n=1 Tax=Acutalibacteraceae TaxID=3082771 RepID=UPI0013E8D9D2|nr:MULTISPECIES: sodium:solute symporter family protein [Acutalibacteraceae]